jgi:hypothetical protein
MLFKRQVLNKDNTVDLAPPNPARLQRTRSSAQVTLFRALQDMPHKKFLKNNPMQTGVIKISYKSACFALCCHVRRVKRQAREQRQDMRTKSHTLIRIINR